MTLRELLLSVDAEQYADSQLYQKLLKVKCLLKVLTKWSSRTSGLK